MRSASFVLVLVPSLSFSSSSIASAQETGAAPPAFVERAEAIQADIAAVIARASPAFLVVSGGSGVIVSSDGWSLTNHHVVASRAIGDRWWVRRAEGEKLRATLVGTDPRGDIALLKLESQKPLPFLNLGDSDAVRIGDLAVALGNPYGFAGGDAAPTVSLGVVSAVHAFRDNYNDAIQTDAAINPGNSGGPLLNLRGEVIGINGRVAVRFGNRMNTGVGYAIPSSQIRRFIPRLKEGGIVRHGWIAGLVVRDSDEGGTAVIERASGAADAAGFREGDILVRVGAREIRSPSGFQSAIGTYPAGDEVTVIVRRANQDLSLRATLAAVGDGTAPSAGRPFLGVRLGGSREGGDSDGIEIASVVKDSPADKAGLRTGDILLRFEGTSIRSQTDLDRLLRNLRPGASVDIEIRRGESDLGIEVELGRAP